MDISDKTVSGIETSGFHVQTAWNGASKRENRRVLSKRAGISQKGVRPVS